MGVKDLLLNDRYRLGQLIGTGGMADVYLAYDAMLEREVAVKVLHDSLATDYTFIENFRREAKAAAKLLHPNIVGIYDVGEDQGKYYIVMEYVKGGHTLKDELETRQLSAKETIAIALNIAEGLKAAHSMGFVHCDIKPQNILLTEDGKAKITDFGIARIVSSSSTLVFGKQEIMGTAHYISPEQAQGKLVDSRSDLYSLGVVLYEMLAGEKAFDGGNPVSIAVKHIQEYPLPLSLCKRSIPAEICLVVDKLMEKEPIHRYPTTAQLIQDLTKINRLLVETPRNEYTQQIPLIVPEKTRPKAEQREKKPEPLPEKKSAFLPKKIWIPALILMFAISFGGVFFLMFDSGAKEIEVPKVEGLLEAEAKTQLEALGLQVEITESMDSQAEQGKVLRQTPIGGAKVKEGRVITLVIAGESNSRVTVPSVVGMSSSDAQNLLEKSGLTVGKVSVGWDATKPAGSVLKQEIRAGDSVAQKAPIDIVVNPEGTVVLPNLRGRSINEAEQIMNQLGLKATIQESTSDGVAGTVTDQVPESGTSMLNEGQVTLFVISKPEQKLISISYTVPNTDQIAEIKVVKVSNGSETILFSKTVKNGDTVEESYEVDLDDRILVYSNSELVMEK